MLTKSSTGAPSSPLCGSRLIQCDSQLVAQCGNGVAQSGDIVLYGGDLAHLFVVARSSNETAHSCNFHCLPIAHRRFPRCNHQLSLGHPQSKLMSLAILVKSSTSQAFISYTTKGIKNGAIAAIRTINTHQHRIVQLPMPLQSWAPQDPRR